MAGGFIMKQATWLGGQTNTVFERAVSIVQSIANLLLETNTGWSLDVSHNATVDDYMIDTEGNPKVAVLFLKSTNGEKLMIGYSTNKNLVIQAPFGFLYSAAQISCVYGLFTSMIPSGSSSTFGMSWLAEGFIPVDATLVHSASMGSPGASGLKSVAELNTNNITYRAQVVTNGSIVSFRIFNELQYGSWWFVGPIISTLAHQSMDTLPTAKMASIRYFGGIAEGSGSTTTVSLNSGSSDSSYWWHSCSPSFYDKFTQIDIFRADGEHIQSSGGHGIFIVSDESQTSTIVSNSSITGFNRWSAYYIGVMSADPTAHYIVKGDGMKGYFDTNFLRKVNSSLYAFGQTFDDGNFVYIGNGVAMGWDSTNGSLYG